MKSNDETISVIVPVYNVEKYISKCIESIINQSYKNLEIILINDGSSDDSGKICDEYAKKDERIKVVHKESEGVSAARNLGVDISTGKYIAFIDSDDWVLEDYCETLYKTILKTDSDISSVSFSMVREDNTVITNTTEESTDSFEDIIIYENEDIIREVLNWKTFKNFVWNKLYKRELVVKHKFISGMNYEDVAFIYELMKDSKRVAYVNKKCYCYLKRRNSITATCSEKNLNDFLDIVINKFNDVKNNTNIEEEYNIYALLESIISISIKYVIANSEYPSVNKKSEQIFEILKKYVDSNENRIIGSLNSFQKVCLYLICYNKELFYSFLRDRQEMKRNGQVE